MRFLENTFDLSQFDEYREDNRREVKKANGGLPTSLWDTYSSFANCYGGVIILGVIQTQLVLHGVEVLPIVQIQKA